MRGKRAGLAFAMALAVPPAFAGVAAQTLAVSTTVSPSAVFGFEVASRPLVITASDMKRGYVEVVMKSRMKVGATRGTDVRPTVVVGMEPRTDLFKSLAVSAPIEDAADSHGNDHSNGNGHSGAKDDSGAASRSVELLSASGSEGAGFGEFRYRLELSDAAKPGGYDTAISVLIDL